MSTTVLVTPLNSFTHETEWRGVMIADTLADTDADDEDNETSTDVHVCADDKGSEGVT